MAQKIVRFPIIFRRISAVIARKNIRLFSSLPDASATPSKMVPSLEEFSDAGRFVDRSNSQSNIQNEIQMEVPSTPFIHPDILKGYEAPEVLEVFSSIRNQLINISTSGEMVVFMRGTPSMPIDFYSRTVVLLLKASGVDIEAMKPIDFHGHLNPKKIVMKPGAHYFNINDNGKDVLDMFYNGLNSAWTPPHFYIGGRFCGCLRQLSAHYQSSTLQSMIPESVVRCEVKR